MKLALGASVAYAIVDLALFYRNIQPINKHNILSICGKYSSSRVHITDRGYLYMLYKKKTTFEPPIYFTPKNIPIAVPIGSGTHHTHYKNKMTGQTFKPYCQVENLDEDQIVADMPVKYFRDDTDYENFCTVHQFDPLKDYANWMSKNKPDKNPFIAKSDIKVTFTEINPTDQIWVMKKNNDIKLFAKSDDHSFSSMAIARCRSPLWKTNLLCAFFLMIMIIILDF